MTAEEKKTLELMQQLRGAVENGSMPLEQFPMEDLVNLVDATLGREFMGVTQGMEKRHFDFLIGSLLGVIQHSIENGDVEGTVKSMMLLEEEYRCFDAMLTAYKGQKFVERYKMISIVAGDAYSKLQYYLHEARRISENKLKVPYKTTRGVIYTTTVLSPVEITQPEYIDLNCDYICFTMDPEKWGTKEGVWEYRKLEVAGIENEKMLQNYCILKPYQLLSEYDYSIWVNPAYKITGDLELLLSSYARDASLLAFPCYVGDDVYELLETGLSTDDENIRMRKKKLQYEKEGYPKHYGIISENIIFRNHNDEKMRQVMETWWQEATECDRMWSFGFNYAAWKHGFDFALADEFVEINPYFKNMVCDLEVKRNE